MVKYSKTCSVPMCGKKASMKGTRFYNIPKNPKILKIWEQRIKRNSRYYCNLKRICSDHFVDADFMPLASNCKRTKLIPSACPSIFPWSKQAKPCHEVTNVNNLEYVPEIEFLPVDNFLEDEEMEIFDEDVNPSADNSKDLMSDVAKFSSVFIVTEDNNIKEIKSKKHLLENGYIDEIKIEIPFSHIESQANNAEDPFSQTVSAFGKNNADNILCSNTEPVSQLHVNEAIMNSDKQPETMSRDKIFDMNCSTLTKAGVVPQKRNINRCSVPMCGNTRSRKIFLHKFPREETLMTRALTNGQMKCVNLADAWCSLTKASRGGAICSVHFLPDDYVPGLKKGVLKPYALPSLKLPPGTALPSSVLLSLLLAPTTPTWKQRTEKEQASNEQNFTSSVIKNMCRICTTFTSSPVHIFSAYGKNEQLESKISKCLNITVDENDADMPLQVCSDCLLKLNYCQKFVDLAAKSSENLRLITARQKEFCNRLQNRLKNITNKKTIQTNAKLSHTHDKESEHSESLNNENMLSIEYGDEMDSLITYIEEETEIIAPLEKTKTVIQCDAPCDKESEHQEPLHDDDTFSIEYADEMDLLITQIEEATEMIAPLEKAGQEAPVLELGVLCDKESEHTESVNDIDSMITETTENEETTVDNAPVLQLQNSEPCEYCPELFNTKSALRNHLKKDHDIFVCSDCTLQYKQHAEYEKHMNEKHIIVCKFCNSSVRDINIKVHITNSHPDFQPQFAQIMIKNYEKVTCKICDSVFDNKRLLKTHYFWKHFVYACDVCVQIFPSLQEQIKHLQEVHVIPCLYCKETFYTSSNYNNHSMYAHKIQSLKKYIGISKTPDEIYECKFCKRGLSSKLNVKRHNFWSHSKYTCAICLETFTTSEKEEAHFKSHGDMCVMCDIRYDCEKDLAEHIAACHPGFKAHSCEDCGDSFNSRSELKDHSNVHKVIVVPDENILCYICGASFITSTVFSEHLKYGHITKETKERKYKECRICHKKFSFESLLKSHLIAHTKQKAYKCCDCKKLFINYKALEYHIQTNGTCSYTFKCDYCPEIFYTKLALTCHLQQMHLD